MEVFSAMREASVSWVMKREEIDSDG